MSTALLQPDPNTPLLDQAHSLQSKALPHGKTLPEVLECMDTHAATLEPAPTTSKRKSQSALTPEAAANLKEIETLAAEGKSSRWQLAVLLDRHVNVFKLKLSLVAKRIGKHGYNEKYLYAYLSLLRHFPTDESREGLQVYSCMEAVKAYNKMPPSQKEKTSPEKIAREMTEKGISGKGIRKTLAEEQRDEANRKAAEEAVKALKDDADIRSNCFHGDCRKLVSQLPDASVKVLWADFPYANYLKDINTKRLVTAGSYGPEIRTACAKDKKHEAEEIALDLLATALPKLVTGGCMVLWQAGGIPPNWKILQAAEQHGWNARFLGMWDKSIPQPGNLEEPFSISSEQFMILYRAGEDIADHSMSIAGRRDIIDEERLVEYFRRNYERLKYEPVTRPFQRKLRKGDAEVGDVHVMMKPDMLNRFFINKLSYEGDLLIDLFGCSGSFCCAAIESKRRWRYCELEQENFNWGVSRIAAAMNSCTV